MSVQMCVLMFVLMCTDVYWCVLVCVLMCVLVCTDENECASWTSQQTSQTNKQSNKQPQRNKQSNKQTIFMSRINTYAVDSVPDHSDLSLWEFMNQRQGFCKHMWRLARQFNVSHVMIPASRRQALHLIFATCGDIQWHVPSNFDLNNTPSHQPRHAERFMRIHVKQAVGKATNNTATKLQHSYHIATRHWNWLLLLQRLKYSQYMQN